MLALITGHPLDFMQWVMYTWSILALIVYAQGLFKIHKPNVLTFSHIFVTFIADTVFASFFTLWFTIQWYSLEGNSSNIEETKSSYSEAPVDYSSQIAHQGASDAFEYGVTMVAAVVSLAEKLYFTFLVASFVQELLLHPKYMLDQDDVEQDLKHQPFWKRWWTKTQKSCYKFAKSFLA